MEADRPLADVADAPVLGVMKRLPGVFPQNANNMQATLYVDPRPAATAAQRNQRQTRPALPRVD